MALSGSSVPLRRQQGVSQWQRRGSQWQRASPWPAGLLSASACLFVASEPLRQQACLFSQRVAAVASVLLFVAAACLFSDSTPFSAGVPRSSAQRVSAWPAACLSSASSVALSGKCASSSPAGRVFSASLPLRPAWLSVAACLSSSASVPLRRRPCLAVVSCL